MNWTQLISENIMLFKRNHPGKKINKILINEFYAQSIGIPDFYKYFNNIPVEFTQSVSEMNIIGDDNDEL